MLLAFVLLGRTLERQARLRAQSDLEALASLIPATSRLVLNASDIPEGGPMPPLQTVEVPTGSLRVGDVLQVRARCHNACTPP